MNARVGALTASPEWFMPWRTIANENDRPALEFELEKVVRGFFRPDLFLDYIRYFVLFEQDGDALIKRSRRSRAIINSTGCGKRCA